MRRVLTGFERKNRLVEMSFAMAPCLGDGVEERSVLWELEG